MPQAQACIDEIQKEARTFNRIYIASIHKVSIYFSSMFINEYFFVLRILQMMT